MFAAHTLSFASIALMHWWCGGVYLRSKVYLRVSENKDLDSLARLKIYCNRWGIISRALATENLWSPTGISKPYPMLAILLQPFPSGVLILRKVSHKEDLTDKGSENQLIAKLSWTTRIWLLSCAYSPGLSRMLPCQQRRTFGKCSDSRFCVIQI